MRVFFYRRTLLRTSPARERKTNGLLGRNYNFIPFPERSTGHKVGLYCQSESAVSDYFFSPFFDSENSENDKRNARKTEKQNENVHIL
mgnify:CR=1 FL=1